MPDLEVEWLGEVPYREALALQEEAIAARRSGSRGDRLLLLEHPPVVTRGSAARPENLRVAENDLASRRPPIATARVPWRAVACRPP